MFSISWFLQLKKEVLNEWKKKIWKSLLGKKYLLEKPVHFSVNNTVNSADKWGFILQLPPGRIQQSTGVLKQIGVHSAIFSALV